MLLREQIEIDLADTLEGEFWLPIELIDPDGNKQVYKKDSTTDLLGGQVLYDIRDTDPETGMPIIVHKPVVTLRITSLDRIPVSGERWGVAIPSAPNPSAPKVMFVLEQATEDGRSIGFIRLYLTRTEQQGR